MNLLIFVFLFNCYFYNIFDSLVNLFKSILENYIKFGIYYLFECIDIVVS